MDCTVDGLHVHYIDEGEGPVLLLLHGWAAPVETYRLLTEHLSKTHRVVVPDMPGCGGTDEPPVPWCVDDYADFILKFAARLGIRETVLLGHSYGGRVIIKLLSNPACPLRVEKAVLIDAAGIKPRRPASYYMKVYGYKAGKAVLSLPGIRHLFPDAVEKLQKKRGSADYRQASPVMRQTMVRSVNEDLTPLLPAIRASTLLIWGENDTATPLADGKLMEARIPGAGLVVLPGAGHFSFADRWEQCRRVLDVFLPS